MAKEEKASYPAAPSFPAASFSNVTVLVGGMQVVIDGRSEAIREQRMTSTELRGNWPSDQFEGGLACVARFCEIFFLGVDTGVTKSYSDFISRAVCS